MSRKSNAEKHDMQVMSNALDFMSKYGITGIQMGSTKYEKSGKNKIKVTRTIKVPKEKNERQKR